MAKRKTSCIKIDTEEVQGEGSWAVVRRMTIGEMRKFRNSFKNFQKENEETEFTWDAFEIGVDIIKSNVISWDWVNDDGEPLPFPKDDPSIVEILTDDEVAILGNAIRGNDEEIKN